MAKNLSSSGSDTRNPLSSEMEKHRSVHCDQAELRADQAPLFSNPEVAPDNVSPTFRLSPPSRQRPNGGASRTSGCCTQLGINVKRIYLQLSRDRTSAIVEIASPIIFAIISIIIWATMANSYQPAETYFSTANLAATTTFFSSLAATMCYNETALPGLGACSAFSSEEQKTLLCGRESTGTPLGLCVLPLATSLATEGWKALANKGSAYMPDLTELIQLKWIASIMYDAYDLSSVGSHSTEASLFYATGALYFAPESDETQKLVEHLTSLSPLFTYVYGGTFSTVSEAEARVEQRRNTDAPIWGILQVNRLVKDDFNVQIRLNNSALPDSSDVLQTNYVGGVPSSGSQMYVFSGFAELQKAVYDYYLKEVAAVAAPPAQLATAPMPTAEFKTQTFLVYVRRYVPIIIVFGFMYPVAQMVKRTVIEKELRLREAMLIMGLTRTVMYCSYFLCFFTAYSLVSIVITVLLKVTYLQHCNFGVLFFLNFGFVLTAIALAGMLSTLFSTATTSAMISRLIYFCMAIPVFALSNPSGAVQLGVSILSPSCYSVGLQLLLEYELGSGFHGNQLTSASDHPNMLLILIMMYVDVIVYTVLMVYFDQVFPQDWGTQKHPLFFLKPIRALRQKYLFRLPRERTEEEHEANHELPENGRAPDGVFEEICDTENSAIKIMGLRKEFGKGPTAITAVNNLYLNMKEGEITVLLGHNGAGKTTTMSMMTGMIQADQGDCFIYGKSVTHDLSAARQEIGYCPQHNILWPELTCREHLWYYASLKGLTGEEREEAIQRMVLGVDLLEKADYPSDALSGGQKRKLSVGIAFVGESRLVFLDEPTAGMDVCARRHTWDMLRALAKYHSILLTTHFMDEADLLGDSVAIMSQGRLQCAGSNMFLKSQLGVGYVLTMAVRPHTSVEPIQSMVRSHVPAAEPLSCAAGEVAFQLPTSSKSVFHQLLRAVEDGEALGITGFSISATTLEEIFIQIANQASSKENTPEGEDVSEEALKSSAWNVSLMEKTSERMVSQLLVTFKKRYWNAIRDRRTQIIQIAIPILCMLLSMLLVRVETVSDKAFVLNSNAYSTDVLVDVVGCDGHLNYDIPFSSQATTEVNPNGASTAESLVDYLSSSYYSHPQGKARYLSLVCEQTINTVASSFVLFNASSTIEVPVGVFNLYNGYYQNAVGTSQQLYTTSRSMPQTQQEKKLASSIKTFTIGIIIMIPFTFIPSTFVSWIVREKETKAKNLQNASGLSFYVYWISNFIFDFLSYLITMFLIILIFLIFHQTEYVGATTFGPTFVLLLLCGLSSIGCAYALSFFFQDYATAQNAVMLGNFITGYLLVVVVVILQLIPSTQNAAKMIRWPFRLIPSFCIGEGIMNLATLKMTEAYGGEESPWGMQVVGWPCVYMAIEFVLFLLIVFFIDHPGRRQRAQRLFHNPDAPPELIPDEDPDVVAEEQEILHSPERASDLVTVQHLRKVYGNGKVAVRNLTFGVKSGEVFGFLGTNGAGKTTTISILSQEFFPTSGHAKVCGYDIVEESAAALRCVGYCPQFDATLDLLTVEEHLYLYAGIRGIAYASRPQVVGSLLALCELTNYRNTKSMELSGGNRRKLSVAISLIGGPRVVFLDEPSAGMDPVARRGLWTAIQTVSSNCAVVLTTHHLEEVEALAHRVAIMVDGALKCIGSKTHLKTKYGSGFELTARLADESNAVRDAAEQFIATQFPGCTLREIRARRLIFELPTTTKLSETFRLLEENSEWLHIIDYSVAQTSIEQVFLRISEEAEVDHVEDQEQQSRGCC